MLYADRSLRASGDVLARHAGGPPQLWAHGISGDIPIVLVRIDEPEDVGIVRQLLYRAGLEWILGVRVRGARLMVDPRIPRAWPGFTVALRFRSARYTIVVENPEGAGSGVSSVHLDGVALGTVAGIPIADDGRAHEVRVRLGEAGRPA